MTSLIDYLEYWAVKHPEKVLFAFRDAQGRIMEQHTYGTFNERTRTIAGHLREVLNLGSGERVLLAYAPGLEGIAALLACARVGLVGVPLPASWTNNKATAYRFQTIMENCDAKAVLSWGEPITKLRNFLNSNSEKKKSYPNLQILDTALATKPSPDLGQRSPLDLFFLQYTSGSTGKPRGVIVTHSNVIANAKATLDHVPIGVSWLPQHHDMGLIGYYLFPIVKGGTNYGLSPSDFLRRPLEWIRAISEVRATYTSSPNFGYEYCLRKGKIRDEDLTGIDLSSLRVLMNAAEPVRPLMFERFYQRFAPYGLKKNACTVAYGLAENTLTVTHGGLGFLHLDRTSFGANLVQIVDHSPQGDSIQMANCGTPAEGVQLSICDPLSGDPKAPLEIGEIVVAGPSVTQGYWNNETLTREVFITKRDTYTGSKERHLRTGDLGFISEGSLYVCGRIKDMIIVNGLNYYPDDIEKAVDNCSHKERIGKTCAFQWEEGTMVLLVEAKNPKNLPEAKDIAAVLRAACSLEPDAVHIVPHKSVVMTTSGKKSRVRTKTLFSNGKIPIWSSYLKNNPISGRNLTSQGDWRETLRQIYSQFDITDDHSNLIALCIDSITLAGLLLEIEEMLHDFGAAQVAEQIDGELFQQLSLNDLFGILGPVFDGTQGGSSISLYSISKFRLINQNTVIERMLSDSKQDLRIKPVIPITKSKKSNVLLTGATGFLGPFLLRELLITTSDKIIVLVRAQTPKEALQRIQKSLERSKLLTPAIGQALCNRVITLCGDLSLPLWGLNRRQWQSLCQGIKAIYHNGAYVNYVKTYEEMKGTNVKGTLTALQLAGEAKAAFHHISSTFVYGWTKKRVLYEQDNNLGMEGLDFGYSQSKWVSEQLVRKAEALDLKVRIYRPSLISISTNGSGDGNDVVVRMLAFMIRYGIAVDSPNQLSIIPADVVAHNIVGISQCSEIQETTFNVTADDYYSMKDITQTITQEYGIPFTYYTIPDFIHRLNRYCSPEDPVYPLLDFFNRSADKITEMELKRYNNNRYKKALEQLDQYRPCPNVKEIVALLMNYLLQQEWVAEVTA